MVTKAYIMMMISFVAIMFAAFFVIFYYMIVNTEREFLVYEQSISVLKDNISEATKNSKLVDRYGVVSSGLLGVEDELVSAHDKIVNRKKMLIYVGGLGFTLIFIGGFLISYKINSSLIKKLVAGPSFAEKDRVDVEGEQKDSVDDAAINTKFNRLLKDYVMNLATPMMLLDHKGNIVFCNAEIAQLLGYKISEIEGRSVDIVLSEDGEPVVEQWGFEGGQPENAISDGEQFEAWHVDGSTLSVSVRLRRVAYDNQDNFLCSIFDMSKKNDLEQKYEQLNNDLKSQVEDRTFELLAAAEEAEQANAGLERETRRIQLLQRISQASDEAYSTEESLHVCLAHVCHYTQWPVGCVYLVDDDTETVLPADLWYMNHAKQYEEFKVYIRSTSHKKGEGVAGKVYESGKAVWVEDFFLEDSKDFEFPLSMGFIGAVGLPITVEDKVVAVLEFFATDSCEFEESVMGLMETIAFQVSRIMERKSSAENLNEALIEAKKANASKSEFLANMSHELRTPMHSIISFSDISLRKIDKVDPEKIKEYLKLINESGKRMLRLINGLLDLSKLEAGKRIFDMRDNDIVDLTNKVISEFGGQLNDKNIKINLDDSFETFIVELDGDSIMQVIRNLVSNAVKFTESGGEITVGYELIDTSISGGSISTMKMWVKDEGVGIPEAELEGVFDKFIQSTLTKTGAGGTGLGLSISREIIHAHKGKIWAESNIDNKGNTIGAKLLFEIPMSQVH